LPRGGGRRGRGGFHQGQCLSIKHVCHKYAVSASDAAACPARFAAAAVYRLTGAGLSFSRQKGVAFMTISVLIAGEDAVKRAKLALPLISAGYHIIEAESGARTAELLKRRQNIALALIDVEMTDISNVDFIAAIRAAGAKMPVIALSGSEDDERLRRAMAAGADDFLIYPVSVNRLTLSVGNILQKSMLRRELRRSVPAGRERPPAVSQWHSGSAAMQAVLAKAKAAAQTGAMVLICGEEASGRRRLARAIHEEGRLGRAPADKNSQSGAAAPFIFIACASALGETGAGLPDKAALEQKSAEAAGGSLCFGNIDRLDKSGQAQLLHFIEQQAENGHMTARRGGAGGQSFRLMATAAADLEELVAEGSFSTGLYKRLGGQPLHLPPLRGRREDIPAIARAALARLVGETGRSPAGGISGAAMALLSQYDWPGNFAELENMLFRAVLSSDGRLLTARDFPQLAREEGEPAAPGDSAVSGRIFYDAAGHIKPLEEIEKSAILEAMQRYRDKISEVARRLKIGRSTLYRKLEDYGLYPDK